MRRFPVALGVAYMVHDDAENPFLVVAMRDEADMMGFFCFTDSSFVCDHVNFVERAETEE
jgi:hypothetical protein